MADSCVQRFSDKIADLKQNRGLKDIKFYPGIISETVPEDFCAEANRLIDAVMSGQGTELKFNDSRKK